MRGKIVALAAVLALTFAAPALAWWDLGHMTIAALAYGKLDPPIRQKVDDLLKRNPAYGSWTAGLAEADRGLAAFTRAAVWADDIKRDPTYTRDKITDATAGQNIAYDKVVHDYWHYIDIPFTTDETPVRAPDAPNALTQLRLFVQTLESSSNDDLKSYDLSWMLHIVGDLHQPLHATARFTRALDDDRGGNDEEVNPADGVKVRLHLYWDAQLGEYGTPAKAAAAAALLPPADPAKAKVLDPSLWLIESFTLAQNDVYTPEVGDAAGPYTLTPAYEARALEVSKAQAALAGERLAGLINGVLK